MIEHHPAELPLLPQRPVLAFAWLRLVSAKWRSTLCTLGPGRFTVILHRECPCLLYRTLSIDRGIAGSSYLWHALESCGSAGLAFFSESGRWGWELWLFESLFQILFWSRLSFSQWFHFLRTNGHESCLGSLSPEVLRIPAESQSCGLVTLGVLHCRSCLTGQSAPDLGTSAIFLTAVSDLRICEGTRDLSACPLL